MIFRWWNHAQIFIFLNGFHVLRGIAEAEVEWDIVRGVQFDVDLVGGVERLGKVR